MRRSEDTKTIDLAAPQGFIERPTIRGSQEQISLTLGNNVQASKLHRARLK